LRSNKRPPAFEILESTYARRMEMAKAKTAAKINVKPLGDRLLVRRPEEDEQIRGGIIIPDTAKEKPQEAEVIAVGPGRRDDKGALVALDVKPGQRILLGKYSGTEVEIDDEEYLIVREDDVLGIIE
jgi:chaperonin GroES